MNTRPAPKELEDQIMNSLGLVRVEINIDKEMWEDLELLGNHDGLIPKAVMREILRKGISEAKTDLIKKYLAERKASTLLCK